MYELVKVGKNTYYIESLTKIGVYKLNNTDVCLIDSGNNKGTGRQVEKVLNKQNWNLKIIINTHSHADHIGGNKLLQDRTGCKIYAPLKELPFIVDPFLEPSFLYGGCPSKDLQNRFLMADPSNAEELTKEVLPKGLEIINLAGHAYSMVGIKTDDNVCFIGDSLVSEDIIEKHHVSYAFNVKNYIKAFETLKTLNCDLYIPSHGKPLTDIKSLIKANSDKTKEVIDLIFKICKTAKSFDEILKEVCDNYNITLNFMQHSLVGSTIRCYLTYLYDDKKLKIDFTNNILTWQVI